MVDYMAANAAAKHVGINDPRSIGKRVEADAWHIDVSGKRDPLFAVETLDEHAEQLRQAVRPGYHGRVEFKLVGKRSNGKPVLQVKPDSVADEPIAPEPAADEPDVQADGHAEPAEPPATQQAQGPLRPLEAAPVTLLDLLAGITGEDNGTFTRSELYAHASDFCAKLGFEMIQLVQQITDLMMSGQVQVVGADSYRIADKAAA